MNEWHGAEGAVLDGVAHDVYFVFFFDMCMEAREEQE
jgi:hypothetical protein